MKQSRVPYSHMAVVWDKDSSQWLFVAIGDIVLYGDIGPRLGLQ